jgi:DNA-binding CsgD family transcriptional regulator
MPDQLPAIAELCFRFEQATTLAPVREGLRTAAGVFGADFFLFAMRGGRTIVPPVQIVISNYPKRWRRRYDELGALSFDPVFATAYQFKGPFRWEGLHKTEQQLALREESVRNGMHHGFSCGDRGPDGSVAILSFCGRQRVAPDPEDWARVATATSLLATATHKAVIRILETRGSRGRGDALALTMAERKCLQMMATPMTAKDAAERLGVKPRTVWYYLDRAAGKLGVLTRREAILTALAQGIIDSRRFPDKGFGSETEIHE